MDYMDYEAPIPESLAECIAEREELVARVKQIDVQFSLFRAGELTTKHGEGWHPKALAAQGHIIARLRKVKARISEINSEEAAARRDEKAQAHLKAAKDAAARAARYKRQLQALHDFVWEAHPESREAVARMAAEFKAEIMDSAE